MQKLFVILLFVIFPILKTTEQKLLEKNLLLIDHVPIVVSNLDSARKFFKEKLHFTIKEGTAHEGIQNFFLKFEDGTYLEITTPLDSKKSIGKYYADFLSKRQGGTQMAICISNIDSISKHLLKKQIPFTKDVNKIWKTISPSGTNLFFIEYANKKWKDSKINTTHTNTAISLRSIYILSDKIETDVSRYKSFGFKQTSNSSFLDIPYNKFIVGKSELNVLDASKAATLKEKFSSQNMTGICGFQIKVKSLKSINNLLADLPSIQIEKNKTIVFLKELNLFLEFCE